MTINNYSKLNDYNNLYLTSEQLLIQLICEERNIRWLCHFTSKSNLEKIKVEGLIPRNKIDGEFIATDEFRYDGHLDTVCLSITTPNKWMFNKKQNDGFDLCLILINPAVLYLKKCAFYPHNAATASFKNIPLESLMNKNALEAMFANSVEFQKSGQSPQTFNRSIFLNKAETTSNQAEVQCYDIIEPHFIEHIIEHNIPLNYKDIESYVNNQNKQIEKDLISVFQRFKESASKEEEILSNMINTMNLSFQIEEDDKKNQTLKSLKINEIEPSKKESESSELRFGKRLALNKSKDIEASDKVFNDEDIDLNAEQKIWESVYGQYNKEPIESEKYNNNSQKSSIKNKEKVNTSKKLKSNVTSKSNYSSSYDDGSGCLVLIVIVILVIMFIF